MKSPYQSFLRALGALALAGTAYAQVPLEAASPQICGPSPARILLHCSGKSAVTVKFT
jgi:hypothetical protein